MTERETPAELFDCLQVNLALLADRWFGAPASLSLGSTLRFRPVDTLAGLPTVARTAHQHLIDAADALGMRVATPVTTSPAASGSSDSHAAAPQYVVADAYYLPWVPYYQRQHMEHSFLSHPAPAGSPVTVEDGYHNETPWGSARPGTWSISPDELRGLPAPILSVTPVADRPDAPVCRSPQLDLGSLADADAYARTYAEHPDRAEALRALTLETWLLSRARALHAAWLDHGRGVPSAAVDDHIAAWRALTEQTYLAHRRVARNRPEPPGLTARLAALLRADHTVLTRAHAELQPVTPLPGVREDTPVQTSGADVRTEVVAVVAEALDGDPELLRNMALLRDVPGYTSFRIAEIIERLEDDFNIEFAPEDLMPENLGSLDGLCGIVARSVTQAGRGTTPPATGREGLL
ncbi:acyl carrier protein [Streptomyces sp. AM 4-1-1]|uniref:acyl carrier protein n=1 Tax=unclassified Streptomyces TaxID=2593676 RepID=UPI0023B956C3|nr:acyl carrier protein [Streptomyces sp. AM 4-1-1]WEH37229.1 acyl carrier protein [Streptomyces sp. AM 4-1-1]